MPLLTSSRPHAVWKDSNTKGTKERTQDERRIAKSKTIIEDRNSTMLNVKQNIGQEIR